MVDPHSQTSSKASEESWLDSDTGATRLPAPATRRRGRPRQMSDQELLERIRRLARSREGLYRVHHRNSRLYARARRRFGTWSAAVWAAGLDYRQALDDARTRSLRTRRRRSLRDDVP